VLSCGGLWEGLNTRPEESYRMCCVVCDLETSRIRWYWSALGSSALEKKKRLYNTDKTPHSWVFDKLTVGQVVQKILTFYVTRGSLQCSREPANGP
jgi:hypothetical protein